MRIRFVEVSAIIALATVPCFAQGTITTYAGNASCCNSADGRPATSTWLPSATGITVDRLGNLYIWEGGSSRVRKVSTAGIITTVAGNGTLGYSGDGGAATSAGLRSGGVVSGLAVDASGNLYLNDGGNQAIRKVNAAGIISTFAGTGTAGFSGDGGPATSAQLDTPAGVAVDNAGNVYIADSSNNRIRMVNVAGVISTVAGNGSIRFAGDGGTATAAGVDRPTGVAVDGAGNLYISETSSSRVRKVDSAGIITTVAGVTAGTNGFSGDGGPATAATLYGPVGLAVDPSGNLYIADNINNRVRRVSAAGIITTYAGNGGGTASTPLGDGGPATSAYIGVAKDVALDSAGNLYIAGNAGGIARVRKVAPAAGLSTNPSSLSFAFTIGGAVPAAQSVSVTSSVAGLSFTATASTTSGGPWLSVNPGSGTAPATLAISVNPAGVPGGVYQGAITLSASGVAPLTFGVTLTVTGAGAPAITSGSVYNALGYQTKLAPGAVFVIFGSGMGPASLVAGTGPDYPTTLGGTSIAFTPTAGGAAITARMVYSVAGQVAGLLPSSIAPGSYAVRVTYNTLASAPQTVTVVPRSIGIATVNSAGTGTAQATIGNVNGGVSLTRFTSGSVAFSGLTWTLSPAHPGDTLVLWGTGGGSDPANDTGGTSGDQTAAGNFTVMVSGRPITPLYAGASSGYAGLWQVNFTLPPDIAADCFAPVQVSAGGELSNSVTIPIAAGGETACSDPQLSRETLGLLDAGGTVVTGGFAVAKATVTSTFTTSAGGAPTTLTVAQDSVSGGFSVYTAAAYAAIYSGVKTGPCTVTDRTASATTKSPSAPVGYMDAGTTIPVAGPGLAQGAALPVASPNPGPVYGLFPNGSVLVEGGKYTLNGTGGKGVGAFTASVNLPPRFSVGGWDALNAIDRGKPLTLNWTGGVDRVVIIGSSSAVLGKDAANNNIVRTVSLYCDVPAAPGTFTVPTSVLSALLPAGLDTASLAKGSASIAVETMTSQMFSAPLTAGGQTAIAAFAGVVAYSRSVAVQ